MKIPQAAAKFLPEQQRPHAGCLPGKKKEATMGFGRGALLWLLGVPLPVIIILALFWHH
ncbi:MAG TPA: hypothetical protein VFB45_10720 [Pseudolabrys sp.]|nr:hypothetical protein [Pseudolabrys sp.]